jgi:NAD(P)-dependent dehydrogenase (short-subunit alcohol dehydrogenase family)
VKFVQVDVTNWESQVKGLETSITASPHGRIDHFIANAGVGGHALTDHIETKRRKNLSLGEPRFGAIQVSLIGSYYLTCLACHHWTSTSTLKALTPFPSGRRSLVIVGSMSSYISMPVGTDYAAAKFGVRGLWSAARETMHTHKLDARINMVSPQFIATNLNKHMQKYYERSGHKFGSVDFAARAVVRMVGDSSVKGRSVTTTIESARDMDDDLSGKYGWTQIEKLIREDLVALYEY